MTVKTRYFVITSLLVIVVGLGTGLVAYYVGFPAGAIFGRSGPEELEYLPNTATVVAYADVREVLASDLLRGLRQSVPPDNQDNQRREFQTLTGINVETDIDHVITCFDASDGGSDHQGNGIFLARGLFDTAKIESLMREHGATVQDYKGQRLLELDHFGPGSVGAFGNPPSNGPAFALTFLEPGLVAFGGVPLVQHAIDLRTGGGPSAASNDELMSHVRPIERSNAWVVGRMDVLRAQTKLPDAVASRLPAITWFTARGQVDGGLRAELTAEARDAAAANNLRDVVRGFLALAKLQTGGQPAFQGFVDSLQLGGAGKTVSLSLDVPLQVFDALRGALPKPPAAQPAPQPPQ